MGSFNTTCFASRQTIAPSDYVTLIPISRSLSYNPLHFGNDYSPQYSFCTNTCHSDAYWTPSGPMLRGKYDDYGRVELAMDAADLENIIELFDYVLKYSVPSLEPEGRDRSFNFSTVYTTGQQYNYAQLIEIWQYLQDAANEYRVFVRDMHKKVLTPFTFAVLHKSTADWLINSIKDAKDYQKNTLSYEFVIGNQFKETCEKWCNDRTESFDRQTIVSMVACETASCSELMLGNHYRAITIYWYKNRFTIDKVEQLLEQYPQFEINFRKDAIEKYEIIVKLVNILQPRLDALYLLEGLENLNIKLEPLTYASQDYSNEIGTNALKMIKAVNKQVKDHRKAQYND